MKSRICSIPEQHGLITISHLVLGVTHFMVDCDEVFLVD